jgi:phosphotransferase system  glucose/maltose/N-acetylglucosamine-specific IIC component
MKETVSQRTKRVLGYLALAIFLSGGCISLVSMETNPFNWPSVCRPIFVLVTFLFFQWLYKDSRSTPEQEENIKKFKEFKECKKTDKDKAKDYYKRME